MKVKVNKDMCIGCGACQAIAGEVFTIGDDGLADTITNIVPDDKKDDAIDAFESCPVGAIEIVEQ